MDFIELAKKRYSVRKYDSRPVEDEKLAKILEAAAAAPTAHNNQPLRFFIIKSAEMREKFKSVTDCTFGAPVLLALCYDTEETWKNDLAPGYDAGEVDTGIVSAHIMLEAADLGLGTCAVRWFRDDVMKEVLALPENIVPGLIITLGYPAENSHPAKLHTLRRDPQEVCTEL